MMTTAPQPPLTDITLQEMGAEETSKHLGSKITTTLQVTLINLKTAHSDRTMTLTFMQPGATVVRTDDKIQAYEQSSSRSWNRNIQSEKNSPSNCSWTKRARQMVTGTTTSCAMVCYHHRVECTVRTTCKWG